MFGGGSHILLKSAGVKKKWNNRKTLKIFFVIVLVTIVPIILYLVMGEPVRLLKIAGVIEAAHIPVVTFLVLYLNHRALPKELRAGKFTFSMTLLAGLFFAVFAVIYILQLAGIIKL